MTYLQSEKSTVAGISDTGTLRGSPNFKAAARRQGASRIRSGALTTHFKDLAFLDNFDRDFNCNHDVD